MADQNQFSYPYYLHPNESPSLILVSPLMNGKNFSSWSCAMKVALTSKNKLVFVNGNITTPEEDDPLFAASERCNTMILSWLHRSLDDSIIQSIIWIDKAYEVWSDLQDRFSQFDMFRISDLQEDFHQINQGDKSISDYFTSLKTISDELNNIRPLHPYTCGNLARMREYRDTDQVIKFLRGLNEQFAHVCSQIMLMSPLPNINRAFSLVLQQERQLQSDTRGGGAKEIIFFANSSDSYRGRGYSYNRGRGRSNIGRGQAIGNKFCTHCKKTNHTIDTCYFKHGLPQGYRSMNYQNSSNAVISEEINNTAAKCENDVQQ
ncbi:uncharacterized protein LOC133318530 [Gastrolobium bilobum]|uniref:uncharacterized protein LOC133318530 n=1 Tax=Gastrolobium bilobum TaxID=150636 RepID=UPI002AB198F9|nr:uncharacterized protein LOC133318530 [Gastrolobium bilobum]